MTNEFHTNELFFLSYSMHLRSWDKVYIVLRSGALLFYKDQKNYKTQPDAYFRGENPVDLTGASAEVASDYTKKKHVFRLK